MSVLCRLSRIGLNQTEIPNNEYYEYYGPDYELDVRASNMTDQNTREYLDKLREGIFEVLRDKDAAPSVQMQGPSSPSCPERAERRLM